MKTILVLTMLFTLMATAFLWGQPVIIGTGTGTNTSGGPAPINILYRSQRTQTVYTAAELNSAGAIGPGAIFTLAYYVADEPLYDLPDFRIRMRHTIATDGSAHIDGPFEDVYYNALYSPTAGDWDTIILTTPFAWNGVDNILVDTAFSQVDAWNSSGRQRIFDSPLGMRFIRSDGSDQTNATTNQTVDYKPQVQLLFVSDAASDSDLAATSISGPEIVDSTQPATYAVTVVNYAANAQNNYTVKLMKGDGIELSSCLVTVNLEFLDQTTVEFDWTPTEVEPTNLYGEVFLAGDQNPNNNQTSPLSLIFFSPPLLGNGSESNPYQIASLEHLLWIVADNDVVPNPDQEARWSSQYVQTADIDASETEYWFDGAGWSPIGIDRYHFFSGSYNGQGYTIGNIYINRPVTTFIGLFGRTEEATISNLGVTNIHIIGGFTVGGLVGYQENSTISNSYSSGSVTGMGGVGVLVGEQKHSTINNSYSAGDVSGYEAIGGLVGVQRNNSTINNSCSTANVIGYAETGVGGLVGVQIESSISYCFSTGSVFGYWDVGGLVGAQIESAISNSFCTGSVSGVNFVGGLVGFHGESTISYSYSTGSVEGEWYAGGLVGRRSESTISNSYWDVETSGQSTSFGGEGRTTTEMTYPYVANTYVEWGFEEIWATDVDYTINDGYPYLQDMPVSVEDEILTVIEPVKLYNYPNPFNPETKISFFLPQYTENLSLTVYNIRGQLVRILIESSSHQKGKYQVIWDGKNDLGLSVTSGVYFCRMTTPGFNQVKKMMLLK